MDAETKKERLELQRELERKEKFLLGIANMSSLPDAIFVIDPKREQIAVNEARSLNIPIFGVVDTNCNPEDIDYPIPGNDDAIRAIALFLKVIVDAIEEGRSGVLEEFVESNDQGASDVSGAGVDDEENAVIDPSAVSDWKEGDRSSAQTNDVSDSDQKEW